LDAREKKREMEAAGGVLGTGSRVKCIVANYLAAFKHGLSKRRDDGSKPRASCLNRTRRRTERSR
jgi:hypothetical protein